MKFSYLFSRAGRAALAASLGLFIAAAPASSDAAIIALKEDTSALDYSIANQYGQSPAGGDFTGFTQFQGLGTGDIVSVHVDDVRLIDNVNAADANLGQQPTLPAGNTANAILLKWDLASLPGFAGSTVTAAVVRLYQLGGNGADAQLGTIGTHDFDEATVTLGSPAGNPVAGTTSGIGEWGPGADSLFSHAADTTAATAVPIDATVTGRGYITFDATSDVAAMAAGTSNFGWAVTSSNHTYISSESVTYPASGPTPRPTGSSVGSAPVLFLQYTPAGIPEPTSALLLGVAGLGLMARRRS